MEACKSDVCGRPLFANPVTLYYCESGEIHQLSYVIISDCLHHGTVAVYVFQRCLVEFPTSKSNSLPQKIFYFSDGSAAQYKNRKNFINLCYHKADFKIDAEWHFFRYMSWKRAMRWLRRFSETTGC